MDLYSSFGITPIHKKWAKTNHYGKKPKNVHEANITWIKFLAVWLLKLLLQTRKRVSKYEINGYTTATSS
jgi:hypothetical protein